MALEVMSSLPGHRASHTLRRSILHRRIGRLLDDGLRDLRVSVPALVHRGACACSEACRCCQLPAHALALPLDSLVLLLRQHIRTLRSSLCLLYSCTASSPRPPTLAHLLLLYTRIYITCINIYVFIYIHIYKCVLSVTAVLLLMYI